MTDYAWPDDLVPYAVSFYLQPHTGGTESSLTHAIKVYGLSAPRWICRMSFRGGYDGTTAQAAFGPRLDAFIAKLKGRQGRVALHDFRREAMRLTPGVEAGLSNLAAVQGAASITITGLPAGETIYAGDYIGGDGRPHIITDDAVAGVDGQATVSIEPPLATEVPAGLAIFGNTPGIFRLTSDDAGDNGVEVGEAVNMTLEFVEDVAAATLLLGYGIEGGADGGIWDLAFWRTTLFQDAAATVPVTAASDPVGCVKNRLGDTSWDMIQSNNALRPTLQFRDGVPYLTGAGKGMQLRAMKNVTMPLWMVAGLGRDADAGAPLGPRFGVFCRSTRNFYFADENGFDSWRVYDDLAAQYTYAPFYAAIPNSFGMVDFVISGGQGSIRINNGGEFEPAHSPLPVTLADGVTLTNSMFGVNVTEQSFSNTYGATVHATANFVWYGGAALMMAPTESERETLIGSFRNQIEPEMRSTDKIIMIDGDSTVDDIDNSGDVGGRGLFLRWADETGTTYAGAQVLRDANPTKTIYYRSWNARGQQWASYKMTQLGSSGDRIFVENAAVAGSQPSYNMAGRFDAVFDIHPHIDEAMWAHGHNMAVAYATVSGPTAKYLRAGEWADSMDKVRQAFPTTPHLLITPHPNMNVGDDSIHAVVDALTYVGGLYTDVDYADIYTPWLAARPQPTWHVGDFIHPSMPTGVTQQLNTFVPAYNAWQSSKPVTVASPLIACGAVPINANPLFSAFASAVPDNWTKFGSGTVVKDTARSDLLLGDPYSVRMTASGSLYIEQTLSAVPYRSQVVTLAVREYYEAGGDATIGRILLNSNGTGAVPLGNGYYDTAAKASDAFRWAYYMVSVPADATLLTIRLYAVASGTGIVNYGRAVLVAGTLPKDVC